MAPADQGLFCGGAFDRGCGHVFGLSADDERWLRIIFEEAGPDPAFTIRRTHADVLITQLAVKLGWDSASYEAAKAEADRISPKTHRADADARHWAMFWRIISNGPAARP
jgi:hypothetical protein